MHLILLATASLLLPAADPSEAATSGDTAKQDEGTTAAQVPAFGLGAQTEVLPPLGGVSALMASYDAVKYEVKASIGAGFFENEPDIYSGNLRIYFPVHRAKAADFSVGGGGGLTLLTSSNDEQFLGTLILGARVRIFVAANVAITGSLGAAATIGSGQGSLLIGARPLGSAGFTYYFR